MRTLGLAGVLLAIACTPNSAPPGPQEIGDGDIAPAGTERLDEPKSILQSPSDDPDRVPADPSDRRSGPGPSIARWKDLDLEVFATALPAEIGDMKRGEVGQMQRGMAGHGAPNAFAQYTDGEGETHFINIVDTQHQCHCRQGMGHRMAEAHGLGPGPHALEFAGNPGMSNTAASGASDVAVWVAD